MYLFCQRIKGYYHFFGHIKSHDIISECILTSDDGIPRIDIDNTLLVVYLIQFWSLIRQVRQEKVKYIVSCDEICEDNLSKNI